MIALKRATILTCVVLLTACSSFGRHSAHEQTVIEVRHLEQQQQKQVGDCIDSGQLFTSSDAHEPIVALCQQTRLRALGAQTYYNDEHSKSPQKSTLYAWQTVVDDAVETNATKDSSGEQLAFLAWEWLETDLQDPQASTVKWSDRVQDALTRSDKDVRSKNKKGKQQQHYAQKALAADKKGEYVVQVDLLFVQPTYALVRVPSLKTLLHMSTRLPRDTRLARLLPSSPAVVVSEKTPSTNLPVPRFKPPLHALLFSDTLDVPYLRKDARILTGEDTYGQHTPAGETDDALINTSKRHWHSRHSATSEARLAAAWIRVRMARDLATLNATCTEWVYDQAYSPNVVCVIPPGAPDAKSPSLNEDSNDNDDGIVVFSAHYDSRGTFGSTQAPGGDDDGSGVTMLLALARHLGTHRVRFTREVRLIAFSGEEQGLVGSQFYAQHLRNQSVPVYFQLQTDMIGYRKPGEPLQVAFPDRLATANATSYVMAIAKLYIPELHVGYTPACCSDHQSFWEQGFTSTWIFERRGPIADPCYHETCDITDRKGYDFEQIRASTRLVLATLLDVAGGVLWPW